MSRRDVSSGVQVVATSAIGTPITPAAEPSAMSRARSRREGLMGDVPAPVAAQCSLKARLPQTAMIASTVRSVIASPSPQEGGIIGQDDRVLPRRDGHGAQEVVRQIDRRRTPSTVALQPGSQTSLSISNAGVSARTASSIRSGSGRV